MARKQAKIRLSKEQQDLAADNLNLARREAWRIQRSTGIDYHTLESVAFEGLCKAAFRYDASMPHPVTGKSMKFSSLATPTIRGELLHWVRDRTYAVRLTHKMRERWVKGRKLLYSGSTDIEIAKALEIELEEWQEVRKVCSGPPLELKEQAAPTVSLEPEEINFGKMYLDEAVNALEDGRNRFPDLVEQFESFLRGVTTKTPRMAIDRLLASSGCLQADFSDKDIDLLEGWEDLGHGRLQGNLF
jgi:RNA polymerase sigma-B factor